MKCLNQKCNAEEIESDDNFCYKCGHWTAKGYSFLNDESNIETITTGATFKQNNRISLLASLLTISIILFTLMLIIRGDGLFKPFFYLKKQAFNYIYGYNTSLMRTDNKYSKKSINTYEEAIDSIKRDFSEQKLYCFNDFEVEQISSSIEENYSIPSVTFCDMSIDESKKIKEVIEKMYQLFPNINGALTNITISNAETNSEYIARFQPMYQFINVNENINDYNKVNKTQILLNSYYFLNEDIINKPIRDIVGENWYVNDATWESTIAHEIGHYISFLTILKKNNINNITFVTQTNYQIINNILEEFNKGEHSQNILEEALNNYNIKYGTNLEKKEFANTISKYASIEDKKGLLVSDETIAEAIHDYYLHGDMMQSSSKEIINVIKSRL